MHTAADGSLETWRLQFAERELRGQKKKQIKLQQPTWSIRVRSKFPTCIGLAATRPSAGQLVLTSSTPGIFLVAVNMVSLAGVANHRSLQNLSFCFRLALCGPHHITSHDGSVCISVQIQ